jgi:hypothetical protein
MKYTGLPHLFSGRKKSKNNALALLGGIGLGAGLMFVLDPNRGARRRALAQNKIVGALNKSGDVIYGKSRDIGNRTKGLFSELKSLFSKKEVTDEVLEARVRSKIGRYISHPGTMEVVAEDGNIILYGPIFEDEVDSLISAVSSVSGVKSVIDQLEIYKRSEAADVPDLQGGSRPKNREVTAD